MACRTWALISRQYSQTVRLTKKSPRNDRDHFFETFVYDADRAVERGDQGAVYRLYKMAAGTRNKEMKSVENGHGELTTTLLEYRQRFEEHRASVLNAKVVTSTHDEIKQPVHKFRNARVPPPSERVEAAINSLKCGKAIGPDDIAAELIKAGGQARVAKLKELSDKIWSFADWPVTWRGGRIRELHKKGSKRDCDKYRGLLISDHLGKAAADMLYDEVAAHMTIICLPSVWWCLQAR